MNHCEGQVLNVARDSAHSFGKQIQESIKAAEEATASAKVAAKAAENAARPGAINITLSGDFDDEVIISVDGTEAARTRSKIIALDRLAPGLRKFSLRSKKAEKEVETSLMAEVKPGLQELTFSLS